MRKYFTLFIISVFVNSIHSQTTNDILKERLYKTQVSDRVYIANLF
jgi:hypothetical protein